MRHSEPKYYVVAFLDLLGTSARFKPLDNIDNLDQAEGARVIENAVFPPLYFRETFNEYLPKIMTTLNSSMTYTLCHTLGIEIPKISITSFSDSVIISLPLLTERREWILFNLQPMICTINIACLCCAAKGFYVRGGIDFGIGVEIKGGSPQEIVSNALTNAVQLEKDVRMPLIAVGERFMSILKTPINPQQEKLPAGSIDLIGPLNQLVTTSIQEMLMTITDQETKKTYYVLDFLNPNSIPGSEQLPAIMRNQIFRGLVQGIEKVLNDTPDASFIAKYQYLREYTIERIGREKYDTYSRI